MTAPRSTAMAALEQVTGRQDEKARTWVDIPWLPFSFGRVVCPLHLGLIAHAGLIIRQAGRPNGSTRLLMIKMRE